METKIQWIRRALRALDLLPAREALTYDVGPAGLETASSDFGHYIVGQAKLHHMWWSFAGEQI